MNVKQAIRLFPLPTLYYSALIHVNDTWLGKNLIRFLMEPIFLRETKLTSSGLTRNIPFESITHRMYRPLDSHSFISDRTYSICSKSAAERCREEIARGGPDKSTAWRYRSSLVRQTFRARKCKLIISFFTTF